MNNKTHKKILVGSVVATLSFLPGCVDKFKGNDNQVAAESITARESVPMTGEVLVTMRGVPAITTDSLEKEKEKLLKANPQLKQALAFMDSREVDRNILEGLVHQKVVDAYIIDNKIDQQPAYQAELRDLCESMERMLNSKYFSERNPVSVSEADMKNFYEANKEKTLRISQGGIAATGIEFADGAAARAFAARAKTSPGGFKKVAQDDNLNAKIKDFKLVNNQSVGIDDKLRDKIVAIKTVPSIEIFEINGMFWVINATSKEEPKYVPYEQIRDRIKEQLEQQKRVEVFTKDVDALKKEYDVQINEEYFKPEETAQPAANAQAMANPVAPEAQAKEDRLA
jgi:hypothetical protein